MPRKTREEKMAAQLRRLKEQLVKGQTPLVSVPSPQSPSAAKKEVLSTPEFRLNNLESTSEPSPRPKELESRYDYTYVASDLKKIALFAIAAVALEIILNLTTRASFVKLILRTFGIEI